MARLLQTHSRSSIVVLFAALAVLATPTSAMVLAQDAAPVIITVSIDGPQYTDSNGNIYVTSATTLLFNVETSELASCTISVHGPDNNDANLLCNIGDNSFSLGDTLASPPDGTYVISATASDTANEVIADLTVILDNTVPEIEISSPVEPIYVLNQQVEAIYECDDGEGSGVASCLDGGSVDTSSVGSHTFEVTATDNLGNKATATVDYSVQYSQELGHMLLPPLQQVSDPLLAKKFKLGRTLPIKFQLCDYEGNFIGTAKATFKLYLNGKEVQVVNKRGANMQDFRYDPVEQLYIYNLSTKNLSKGVFKIVITLDDGTEISTYFELA